MNVKDVSLKWKTVVPVTIMFFLLILITVIVTGLETRRIVLEEVERSTHPAYRDTILNSLTTMMVAGNFKESKKPFLEQMKHIVELRVIRSEVLDKDYGKGDPADYPADQLEKDVIGNGKEKTLIEGDYIRAVYPYTAKENVMGKNCLSCHKVTEGTILGAISIKIPISESFRRIRNLQYMYGALGLLGIVFITFVVVIVVNVTHKPLVELTSNMKETAEKHVELKVSFTGRDEIGLMAENANKVIQYFNNMINRIMITTSKILPIVDVLKSMLEKTSEGAKSQTTQSAQIAAAAEEMKLTITDIARSTASASETSTLAMESAVNGKKIADGAVETVNRVHKSSDELAVMINKLNSRVSEIGNVVTVIKEIADQTNLLALNAAIEAARAGEQGRGFAVVADEVRKLAEKTIKATTEIASNINAVQIETEQTTRSMGEASAEVSKATDYIRQVGDSLNSIVETVQNMRDQITQISTAVDEQSAASEEVAKNIEKTHSIAGSMEKMSGDVLKEVMKLTGITDELRTETAGVKTRGSAMVMLELAKTDHRGFVGKIGSCLKGDIQMVASQMPDHHTCRFGKWYDKEGSAICGELQSYKAIEKPHEKIHIIAKNAVEAHNAGNEAKARQLFNELEAISHEIVDHLDEIKSQAS